MYRIIRGLLRRRWILRSICKTIFFNFYYLPFRQAIYLPILLYKPKFLKLRGMITIINKSGGGKIWNGYIGSFYFSFIPEFGLSVI